MSTSEDERESRIDSILKRAEKLAYALKFAEDKATWLRLSAKLMEILGGLKLWQLEECSDEVLLKWMEHEESIKQAPPVGSPIHPLFLDLEVHTGEPSTKSYGQEISDILSSLDDSRVKEADADLKKAEADLFKELRKDIRDRRHK